MSISESFSLITWPAIQLAFDPGDRAILDANVAIPNNQELTIMQVPRLAASLTLMLYSMIASSGSAPTNAITEEQAKRAAESAARMIRAAPALPVGAQARTRQAGDWRVWRAFYQGLQHAEAQVPGQGRGVLRARTDATSAEADAVLRAGDEYLRAVKQIENDMTFTISQRFPDAEILRQAYANRDPRSVAPVRMPTFSAKTMAEARKGPVNFGKQIRDSLEADGSIARYEEQMAAVLKGHTNRLYTVVGYAKLAKQTAFIESTVAYRVRIVEQIEAPQTEPTPGIRGNPTFNQSGR